MRERDRGVDDEQRLWTAAGHLAKRPVEPLGSRKLDQDHGQPEQSRSPFGFLYLDLPRHVSKNGETDQLRDDFLEQIEALAR